MKNKNLCSTCRTAYEMIKVDGGDSVCPYILYHDGKKCSFYKKMKEPRKKRNIFSFFKR